MPATTWWVDAAASPGGAGDQANPFKTINAAAAVALAGDTVLIRGGTYRETITPAHSGVAGAPIVYQAYQNEKVVVSGADLVSGAWSNYAGQVYSINLSGALNARDFGTDQVFVNGRMMIWARWPNLPEPDPSNPVWAYAEQYTGPVALSRGGEFSLTIGNLPGDASEYAGGIVHVMTGLEYVADTGVIKPTSAGSTVRFNLLENGLETGNRFYIEGAFKALDHESEWFIGSSGGQRTLYLWQTGGGNPGQGENTVELKQRDLGFDLSGVSYVTLDGVDLFACRLITSNSSSNVTINNMDARYLDHYSMVQDLGAGYYPLFVFGNTGGGIELRGANNTLENSVVAYTAGNGVFVNGTGHRILNNVIHDVNYFGSDAAAVSTGAGMPDTIPFEPIPAVNIEIANNTLFNAGRALINHRNIKASSIHHNDMSFAMLQAEDGGATYSFESDGQGTVIAYNMIHDIYPAPSPASPALKHAAGIYLDGNSRNYVVHDNVVWNSQIGMQISLSDGAQNHLIYNNTLVGDKIGVNSQGSPGQGVAQTRFINNVVVSGDPLAILLAPSTLSQSSNTLMAAASMTDLHFLDPKRGDYRLRLDSPLIDAGEVISGVTLDYSGAAPERGAYELGAMLDRASASLANLNAFGVGATRVYARIEAEDFWSSAGVVATKTAVTGVDAGDVIGLGAIIFNNAAVGVVARVARRAADSPGVRQLEVWIDGPSAAAGGRKVGAIVMPDTGSWTTFVDAAASFTENVQGLHDVYLVGAGGAAVASVDYLRLTPARDSYGAIEAESADLYNGAAAPAFPGSFIGLNKGDTVAYRAVDLGSGAALLQMALVGLGAGGNRSISVYVDGPPGSGSLIATVAINGTTPQIVTAEVNGLTPGLHDVHLVANGDAQTTAIAAIDFFRFAPLRSPRGQIQAESFDASQGVSATGTSAISFDPGDWALFRSVDFTAAAGVISLSAARAAPGAGSLEIWVDAPSSGQGGTRLATLTIDSTGSASTYRTYWATLSSAPTGVRNLYLVAADAIDQVDGFRFAPPRDALAITEAETYDDNRGVGVATSYTTFVTGFTGSIGAYDPATSRYLAYHGMTFSEAPVSIQLQLKSVEKLGTQQIEVWANGLPWQGGVLVGTVNVPKTSGKFDLATAAITGLSAGVHDIYLLGTSSGPGTWLADLDWLRFVAASASLPTVQVAPILSGFEKAEMILRGSGDGAITAFQWDLNNDGVYETSGANVSFVPADNGVHTVGFRAVGPNGTTSTSTKVYVANVDPTASFAYVQYATVRGMPTQIAVSAGDVSTVDKNSTFTYLFDWNNDGLVDEQITGPSNFAVSHVFQSTGAQSIRLWVIDKDYGVSVAAATATIVVSEWGVVLDPDSIFDLTNPKFNLVYGGTIGNDMIVVVGTSNNNVAIIPAPGAPVIRPTSPTGAFHKILVYAQGGNDTIYTAFTRGKFEIHAGDGDDLIMSAYQLDGSLKLYGDAGNDAISFYGGVGGAVEVHGGQGADNLELADAGNGVNLAFYGESGDDIIYSSASNQTTPLLFDGGDDNDLILGGAAPESLVGGAGDDSIVSGAGNDTVTGGAGNDVLVGAIDTDGGSDSLDGGDGDDILIAIMGSGASGGATLAGGAGQNLVIAGRVVFNDPFTALDAIIAEWRSGRSFDEKIANLSGTGVGPRANGNTFLQANATVFDNGVVDTIFSGAGANWLFLRMGQDIVNNLTSQDRTKNL